LGGFFGRCWEGGTGPRGLAGQFGVWGGGGGGVGWGGGGGLTR